MAHVEILIGSETDIPELKNSVLPDKLEAAGVSYAVSVCSAHRHLFRLISRVFRTRKKTAVYVCAAGWSAALPGVVKAILLGNSLATVIGIAIPSEKYPHGEDAEISITRIPGGVGVNYGGVGTAGFDAIADEVIELARSYNPNPDPKELERIKTKLKKPKFDINLKEAS